ncbi:MAG: permease [Alphaproteobacteria bacterium]
MDQIIEAFTTGAGMLWKALWALIFGYFISAGIQIFVTRDQMARVLGDRGARKAGIAGFFGFVSSSCSFAALAALRSILVKGAHPVNSIAFLISSTNLVIELGLVLLVLLGWKFMVANFLLGILMTIYAYALTLIWLPRSFVESAKEHAEKAQSDEGMDRDQTMKGPFRDKLLSREGWDRIARAFFMEWKMVWKEILFGFTVAGFISVFVPQSFWNAIFLVADGGAQDAPGFLIVLENALVAPVVAFFTFIGSMGNVPLAAMLWSRDRLSRSRSCCCHGDMGARKVLWLAVCALSFRLAVPVHGRCGNYGALPVRSRRDDPDRAALASGDGPVQHRLHVLTQPDLSRDRVSTDLASPQKRQGKLTD